MRSIAKGLPRQPRQDRHFAALPYTEVPGLLAKLAESDSIGRLALQFTIATAGRSGEVRGATWSEIDLNARTWTIPPDRMKAGKVHIVPLSPLAMEVLRRAGAGVLSTNPEGMVFPGLRNKPLSDMTMAKALKLAGYGDFTVHGFRSSFRDWAAEMTGTPGDVVEAALAHTIANRVEAAYRRTNYLDKRRTLMDAWSDYIAPQASISTALPDEVTGAPQASRGPA
jgi:integrase